MVSADRFDVLDDELERIAQGCVPGSGAVDIERLGTGLVNQTYRVARAGRLYSLRVAAANSQDFGLDRAWELRVLEAAMAAGVAPVIEYCDTQRGILVARWSDGHEWSAADVRRPENIGRIAALMRRIHALPVPRQARVMHPAAWIEHYDRALAAHGIESGGPPAELRTLARARQAELAELPDLIGALCHSDLHPLNVIVLEHACVVLDWEYAHVSEPLWDLAGWTANNDLQATAQDQLLECYLGRRATADQRSRLQLLAWLYDYVCLLWSELYLTLRPGPAADGVAVRAKVLTARLARSEPG